MSSDESAILLVSCPDRRGLVAVIANFLFERGANVKHADQHEDREAGLFLMRVEWGLDGCTVDFDGFASEFAPVAAALAMTWRLERSQQLTRLAIFVSQVGHCLADLLYRWSSRDLGCDIAVVIGNHRDHEAMVRQHGLPFEYLPLTRDTRLQVERRQLELMAEHQVGLIALARYMQILSPAFLQEFGRPVINVHHSFLPAFSGARPYHRAFERGVKLIGATSHYVTDQLDEGPIIEQDVIRVSHRDDVDRLIRRGRDLERVVLSRAVQWHAQHRLLVYSGKTVVFD